MKKISLYPFLVLLLITSSAFSQIGKAKEKKEKYTIGKLTNPYKYVELSYINVNDEKVYSLSFKNLKYQELTDICVVTFKATKEELDYLYDTLHSMTKAKGKSVDLTIGNGKLTLNGKRSQVDIYAKVEGQPSKYTWLNKNQIDKIFARKRK